jgi:tetratricopeptide (TPR) repeat protein
VWSLGIALSECATLKHPFEAATREGLFHAILSEEPSNPRRANAAIDKDFATILETATAKDRDHRYQTALDLAEDLRRWLAMEPIRARPIGRFERARRWTQRNPLLAAGAAAIILLLLGSSALLSYGLGAAGRAGIEAGLREVAERERAAAEEARNVLEQIQADQLLAEELDELTMQTGTLVYGPYGKEAVPSLVPKYFSALERFGVDLAKPGSVEPALARFSALRERNHDLWAIVDGALTLLASLVEAPNMQVGEPARSQMLDLARRLPEQDWPELAQAVKAHKERGADEFGPLLEPALLATRSSAQLSQLASELMGIEGRVADAMEVLEGAIWKDPGSFQLHFLTGAFGFMHAGEAMQKNPEQFQARASKLVHHMEVAVALRPRSGFVRAMLANAYAMSGRYPESGRCIEEATELEPDNALVWLFKGLYYSFSPSPEAGIEACKKALELDPDLAGAHELLAQLESGVPRVPPVPQVKD